MFLVFVVLLIYAVISTVFAAVFAWKTLGYTDVGDKIFFIFIGVCGSIIISLVLGGTIEYAAFVTSG